MPDIEQSDEKKPNTGNSMSEETVNPMADYYVNLTEQSFYESSYVQQTLFRPYNPDDLYQKQNDYSLYEDMLKDDQVNACFQLKLDLVCGSGWDVIPTTNSNEKYATETQKILDENGEVSFDECIEDFARTAYSTGFALAEKIFEVLPNDMLALKALKTRHPGSWLIHTDERGNITRYQQHGPKGDIDINPKNLIHYINNREQQNPYGTSDLRKCYQAWFTKTHIARYYAIYLEKAAGPIPVGRYPASLPQERVNELFNIIKGFQSKSSVVIPKEVEMEFLQANGNGESYIKGINLFNMFIGRSLFVPDLVGFQGSETGGGSFTLGKNQMDLFFKHIQKRRRTLERLINKHIIQPMCIWNYGIQEDFPKFQFKPISDENALDYAKVFLEAIKGKVYVATPEEINHFRSLIKFPENENVEFPEEQDPELQGEGNGDPNSEDLPEDEKEEKEKEPADDSEETKDEIAKYSYELKAFGGPGSGRHAEGGGDKTKQVTEKLAQAQAREKVALQKMQMLQNNHSTYWESDAYKSAAAEYKSAVRARQKATREAKKELERLKTEVRGFKKKSFRSKTQYEKRIDFSLIKGQLETGYKECVAESQPIVKKIIDDYLAQIKSKGVLQNVEKLDSLKIKFLNDLNRMLKNNLKEHYVKMKKTALAETVEFDKKEYAAEPLPTDKFTKILDEETYQYVGDWEYKITKQARIEIIKAIKDGTPVDDVLKSLKGGLSEMSDASIERYARTKFTEVMNYARLEQFEESGVVAAYQFSAILDDSTTDICGELDGKIFEYEDAPIPPLHFNCRSLLVPISKFEDYSVDKKTSDGKDIDKYIASELEGTGFSKFSRRCSHGKDN